MGKARASGRARAFFASDAPPAAPATGALPRATCAPD